MTQWRIYIGKFWAPPPSKFFQFHAVLGKFGKIVCWCPFPGEILDPPLQLAPISLIFVANGPLDLVLRPYLFRDPRLCSDLRL